MKILVLSNLYPPDYIGGYECGCKQAVDALLARGHDVRVLTTAPRTPVSSVPHVRRQWALHDDWDAYGIARSCSVTVRLGEARSSWVSAFNVHVLTHEVEAFRPDVVYVWNLIGLGGIGLMATLQHLGVPWLWHLMDDIPVILCRLGTRMMGSLRDEFARQLDGDFLACSLQLVEEVEAGGIPIRDRTELLTNWVVGQPPVSRERSFRPGQTLRVASAGQVSANKGVDLLIEGAGLLRDAGHTDFLVDIYGRVEDQTFPTLARRLGLADHVRFLGSRPQAELLDAYRDYDVFAFPTWQREPNAFAPLEAAWRGCVPLVSQLCGNAEWLVHGVHCLKIERSARGVAGALTSIADGRVDLAPLARRAAAAIDRDFHLDAIVPRIERALARVASRPARPSGSSAEAYRLALLAEKLARVLIQEAA